MIDAADEAAYDELCCYTLNHGGTEFLHQYVVDAWAAQHAKEPAEQTKPIHLTFALIGLYLHVERGFTGREVQRAHMKLARRKHAWPRFEVPERRAEASAAGVMEAPPGPARDAAIRAWAAAVWNAWRDSRLVVEELLRKHDIA